MTRVKPLTERQLAALYKPDAKAPVLVTVPPLRFLQLEGVGDIGGDAFREAVAALYALAYATKFAAKKQLGLTYKVAPLEGIYWHADDVVDFDPAELGAPASTIAANADAASSNAANRGESVTLLS